jgi:uncharacterized protein
MLNRRDIETIDGAAGPIEVLIETPPETTAKGIALICHPHPLQGGTMDNKVVQTLAKSFLELGYIAVRFNFRGVGKSAGEFDHGIGETEDADRVLQMARARFGASLPVAAAGFSFGTYVQTRLLERSRPHLLVLVGPAVKRFDIPVVPRDTLVVHGEEDDVVALADVMAWARPQALPLVVFPGAGHFFHGRLTELKATVKRHCIGVSAALTVE